MTKRTQTETLTASEADITRCVNFHDLEKERAAVCADSAKAALEPLAEKGMRLDALKAALRLRQLEPLALAAWFQSFEAACAALNLDAQEEMFPRDVERITGPTVN